MIIQYLVMTTASGKNSPRIDFFTLINAFITNIIKLNVPTNRDDSQREIQINVIDVRYFFFVKL